MAKLSTLMLGLVLLLPACEPAPPSPGASPDKPASATSTGATTTSAGAAASSPQPSSEPTASSTTTAEASATASASADPKVAATATATGTTSAAPTTTTTASAAPSAVASGPDVQGTEKKDAGYSAYLSAKSSYKAGEAGTVTAVVNATGEYKINAEYPYKFTLDAAPAGVSYSETVVRNVTRSEKKASISIPFTPANKGTATISGTCAFSVCTASNCVIQKVPMSVTVKVE